MSELTIVLFVVQACIGQRGVLPVSLLGATAAAPVPHVCAPGTWGHHFTPRDSPPTLAQALSPVQAVVIYICSRMKVY